MAVNTYLKLISQIFAELAADYELAQDDKVIVQLLMDLKNSVDWRETDEEIRTDQALAHFDLLIANLQTLRTALQSHRSKIQPKGS